jgi:hypothetical protein
MENSQTQRLTVLSTLKFRHRFHWDIPRGHIVLREMRPSTTAYLLGDGQFSKKFEMILMLLSGAWGKVIHEKNLKQKIS